MTRIAIVEDEEKYYHILKEYIQKYAGENSEEICRLPRLLTQQGLTTIERVDDAG